MTYWAVSELHLDYAEAIWKIPLPMLLLCVRENQRQINKNGITLQDKEMIDEMTKKKADNGK